MYLVRFHHKDVWLLTHCCFSGSSYHNAVLLQQRSNKHGSLLIVRVCCASRLNLCCANPNAGSNIKSMDELLPNTELLWVRLLSQLLLFPASLCTAHYNSVLSIITVNQNLVTMVRCTDVNSVNPPKTAGFELNLKNRCFFHFVSSQ